MVEFFGVLAFGLALAAIGWGSFLVIFSKYLIGYSVSIADIYYIIFKSDRQSVRQMTFQTQSTSSFGRANDQAIILTLNPGGGDLIRAVGFEATGSTAYISVGRVR